MHPAWLKAFVNLTTLLQTFFGGELENKSGGFLVGYIMGKHPNTAEISYTIRGSVTM
jgi:hypothetical protein